MVTRRQFGKMAVAGLSLSAMPWSKLFAAAKLDSTVRGVKLGIITGSLNPVMPAPGTDIVDTVIKECIEVGAGNIEFVNTLLEPDFPGLNHRGGQVPATITPEY